jgi:hypothetical protein
MRNKKSNETRLTGVLIRECERQQIRWVVVCRESLSRTVGSSSKGPTTKFDVYTLVASNDRLRYHGTFFKDVFSFPLVFLF